MKVSAVIPTRNRANLIRRLCGNLQAQTCALAEIIIVDSSDENAYRNSILSEFPHLPIVWIDSEPSVCIQRNKGIQRATSPWILLCDDDIELPADYMEKLAAYAAANPGSGALAGRLLQYENGHWQDQYPVKDFKDLAWRFVFQLSIWGDIDHIKIPSYLKPVFSLMENFYRKRGNGFSLAGWPLITHWKEDVFRTSIYSLGANVIKREWLLESPYDEVLDPSGIGDNYGVAAGFPEKNAIHVLGNTHAYHHRAEENRLLRSTAYFRRILALHYFLKRRQKRIQRVWFIWSLTGNWIHQKIRRHELSTATLKAIKLVLTGRNPYWEGFIKNKKTIQPPL